MKISAAVVEAPGGPFVIQELELGEPRANEVLVDVVAAGICHTDLVARNQEYPVPLPVVLGHEGAGVVREVGDGVQGVRPGDKVLLSFDACYRCQTCLSGRPSYCLHAFDYSFGCSRPDGSSALSRNGTRIHGHFFGQSSFATAAIVSERCLVPVPADADLAILAPLGCGIQTGAGAVLRSLRPPAGSSIGVFGVGAVGLSAIMAARVAGCTTIVAVDLNEKRLRLARELGATETIAAREVGDVVDAIRECTDGLGLGWALDTTGRPDVVRNATDALMVAGTFGLIGASPVGTEVRLDLTHMLFGRTFRGIIQGDSVPSIFIPQLLELHRQGQFPFERLVEAFPFEQINEAAELARRGDVIKPVLTF